MRFLIRRIRREGAPALMIILAGMAVNSLVLKTSAQAPAPAAAPPPRLGTEFGISAFERECTKCHGNAAVDRAPSPAAIRQMPPERIYAALTTGVMQTQAASLTDEQKRRLAEYMGGRPLGSAALGDASQMPNRCAAQASLSNPSKAPAWNGWGVDAHNTRFQSAEGAGLTTAQVPNLKLKWAFGFPLGVSAFGQPSVVCWPRVCRLRYRLCLFARYAHGLRVLVVSGQGGRAHCRYGWAHRRREFVSIRSLLRRHAGKCVCGGRGVRRSAVDQARGGSFRRSHYRSSNSL